MWILWGHKFWGFQGSKCPEEPADQLVAGGMVSVSGGLPEVEGPEHLKFFWADVGREWASDRDVPEGAGFWWWQSQWVQPQHEGSGGRSGDTQTAVCLGEGRSSCGPWPCRAGSWDLGWRGSSWAKVSSKWGGRRAASRFAGKENTASMKLSPGCHKV